MAHVFPKRPVSSTTIMSVDELNENMLAIAQEAGRLNEHNFKNGCQSSSVLYVEPGAAVALRAVKSDVDHEADFETLATSRPADIDLVLLEESSLWTTLEELEIETYNSLIWVLFSLQYSCHTNDYTETGGAEFAVAIDGVIVAETITGTLDLDNAYAANLLSQQGGTGPILPNRVRGCPISNDVVLPITAGRHTISLVGRQLIYNTISVGSNVSACVLSRTLIPIELRR